MNTLSDQPAVSPTPFAQVVFLIAMLFCLTPWASSASALVLGVALTLTLGNPFLEFMKNSTKRMLAYSVVGLGFGMNLSVIGKVGMQGVTYTVLGITFTICLGVLLGKLLKAAPETSLLITVGTAICGGSAIAAVAPTIRAKASDISVSLAIVFLLNACALVIFPSLGHRFGLSQNQFGLWCALAIHDTSSVVGASMQYGAEALQIATTVKLARALWIIPVALLTGILYSRKNPHAARAKAQRPWFILGFILAAALVTFFPILQATGHLIENAAKHLLVLTLFCIGASLTKAALKTVGVRPLALGILLWCMVSSLTLFSILQGWIH